MGLKEEVIDMKKEVKEVREQRTRSFAYELLDGYKKSNKRYFIIIIILIICWFSTMGYLVYVLNDISTVETNEVSQENDNGYNNYIGNDGDISNGKANN